jgi:hypothetical protein
MRVLFFSLLSVLPFINVSIAQSGTHKEVPDKIANAFVIRYPTFNIRKWSVKNDIYTVHFIRDKKKSTAFYNSNGSWIRTGTIVSWRLPLDVKKGVYKSEFASWYVETIKEYETPEKAFYRFLIDNGNLLDSDHHDVFLKNYNIGFSIGGQLLNKSVVE